MAKKVKKEEERWMKERAKQEHGGVAMSKLYSKQEKQRKDRLKKVKSVISSQMGDKPVIKRNRRPRPGGGGAEKPLRSQRDPEQVLKQKKKTHAVSEGGAKNKSPRRRRIPEEFDQDLQDDNEIYASLEANPLGKYLEAFHKSWAIEDIQALSNEATRDAKAQKMPTKNPIDLALGFSPDGTTPQMEKQKGFFSPGALAEQQAFSTEADALDLMDDGSGVPAYEHVKKANRRHHHQHKTNQEIRRSKKEIKRSQTEEAARGNKQVAEEEDSEEEGERPWSSPHRKHSRLRHHAANVQESARRKPRNYNSAPVQSTRKKHSKNAEKSHLPDIHQPVAEKNLGSQYRDKRKMLRQRRHPGGGPKKFLEDSSQPEATEKDFQEGLGSPVRFPMKPRHSKRMSPADSPDKKGRKFSSALASPQRVKVAIRSKKSKENVKDDDEKALAKRRADRRRAADRLREHRRKAQELEEQRRQEEQKAKKSARTSVSKADSASENDSEHLDRDTDLKQEAAPPPEKSMKKALDVVGKQRRLRELQSEHQEALDMLKELDEGNQVSIDLEIDDASVGLGSPADDNSINKLKSRKVSSINMDFSLEGLKKKAEASNKFQEMFSSRSGPLSRPRPVSREDYKNWWKKNMKTSGPDDEEEAKGDCPTPLDTKPRTAENDDDGPHPHSGMLIHDTGDEPGIGRQSSDDEEIELSSHQIVEPPMPSPLKAGNNVNDLNNEKEPDHKDCGDAAVDDTAVTEEDSKNMASNKQGPAKDTKDSNIEEVLSDKCTEDLADEHRHIPDTEFFENIEDSNIEEVSGDKGVRDVADENSPVPDTKSNEKVEDGSVNDSSTEEVPGNKDAGDVADEDSTIPQVDSKELTSEEQDAAKENVKVDSVITEANPQEVLDDKDNGDMVDEPSPIPESDSKDSSFDEQDAVKENIEGVVQEKNEADLPQTERHNVNEEDNEEDVQVSIEMIRQRSDDDALKQDDSSLLKDDLARSQEEDEGALEQDEDVCFKEENSVEQDKYACSKDDSDNLDGDEDSHTQDEIEDASSKSNGQTSQIDDEIALWQAKVAQIQPQSPSGNDNVEAGQGINEDRNGPASPEKEEAKISARLDPGALEVPVEQVSVDSKSQEVQDTPLPSESVQSQSHQLDTSSAMGNQPDSDSSPAAPLELLVKAQQGEVATNSQADDADSVEGEKPASDVLGREELLSPSPTSSLHSSQASSGPEDNEGQKIEQSSDVAKKEVRIGAENRSEEPNEDCDYGVEETKMSLPNESSQNTGDISALVFGKASSSSSLSEDSDQPETQKQASHSEGLEKDIVSRRQSGWNEITDEQVENLEVQEDILPLDTEEGLNGKIFVGDGKYVSAPLTSSIDEGHSSPKKTGDASESEDDDYEDEDFETNSEPESSNG